VNQQLISIATELVEKRHFVKTIHVLGTVAYDPELYEAQQEFVSTIGTIKSLTDSATSKLERLGMSATEIKELADKKEPDQSLYLPSTEDTIWVYLTVFENQRSMVHENTPITVTTSSYPGKKFSGRIIATGPNVDPTTRSLKVRAKVGNSDHLLKPKMFVDAVISSDRGFKLTIPKNAVIFTGNHTKTFVSKLDARFEARDIQIGEESNGYYEVLSGVFENERVVTNGNFLIDSESRL